MESPLTNLTATQLRRAADIKERIEALQDELAGLVGGAAPVAAKPGQRRSISPAGIARIRAAQKARWAAAKQAKKTPGAKPQPKRKMSAGARARLAAIAKARWAKAKAQGKKAL